jgi:hypothetical protein
MGDLFDMLSLSERRSLIVATGDKVTEVREYGYTGEQCKKSLGGYFPLIKSKATLVHQSSVNFILDALDLIFESPDRVFFNKECDIVSAVSGEPELVIHVITEKFL